MIEEQQAQLVILAGGKGSRLGADKSRIVIDGTPILAHLMQRLAWAGSSILIKSQTQSSLAGESLFGGVVRDEHAEQGPMGGIVTAINAGQATSLLILPVDLPRIARREVFFLLSQAVADEVCCFQRIDEAGQTSIEPFPLLIGSGCRRAVLDHFASGKRSLRSLLELSTSRAIPVPADWPSEVWHNINREEDLRRAGGSIE